MGAVILPDRMRSRGVGGIVANSSPRAGVSGVAGGGVVGKPRHGQRRRMRCVAAPNYVGEATAGQTRVVARGRIRAGGPSGVRRRAVVKCSERRGWERVRESVVAGEVAARVLAAAVAGTVRSESRRQRSDSD